MAKKIFIKPSRKDLLVRDPVSRELLPSEGKLVLSNSYWVRRIKDGDVIEGSPKVKAKKTKTVVKDGQVNIDVPVVDELMNTEG